MKRHILLLFAGLLALSSCSDNKQPKVCLTVKEAYAPFSEADAKEFAHPDKIHYPETWFHFIGGNVDREGITKDLEAIAGARISGIHLFHGQFGGDWPGVKEHVTCLDSNWNSLVNHTASEAKRLGLRFTMQNCPGWSMSGGPWIKPEDAIRILAYTRTDINGGTQVNVNLPSACNPSEAEWRNYTDLMVLAFPTPDGDTDAPLCPSSVTATENSEVWSVLLNGGSAGMSVAPGTHTIEVKYDEPQTVRSIVFSPISTMNHPWIGEPGIDTRIEAVAEDGSKVTILDDSMPMSNWQDDVYPMTFATDECTAKTFLIHIKNAHDMAINRLQLLSSARKNNWEAEAAWTLRSTPYASEHPQQSVSAFVKADSIIDITDYMQADGTLAWDAPQGQWTVLRIGHVNSGMKNGPAPAEATGWECNKLSKSAADIQFNNYIGKIADGPAKGLLDGMLMDSWECRSQTWTQDMEEQFASMNDYQLRSWLPAVFGYVIDSHETTARFLSDWRSCISHLFTENFYGRMAENAHSKHLNYQFETAAGDIFPADILEYYKYADVPMTEFWNHPDPDSYVGAFNFKPIRFIASASRLYGKTRIDAESLTSFYLTWDEHFSRLKDVANQNYVRGVTHSVFHTYTHNPCADTMVPGTSFGFTIGTPFLRGQTWWKYMPEFTDYFARMSYMLERGRPVSDVLWYLGDCSMHKPDENYKFPDGFKYDFCNQDILINRMSVKDGRLVSTEGISYSFLWIPDNHHMLPATAARLKELLEQGATVVSEAPLEIGTLNDAGTYDADVAEIWGEGSGKELRSIGKGRLFKGYSLEDAIAELGLKQDLVADGELGWLHRQAGSADWYFLTAPLEGTFIGKVSIMNTGAVSLWNPVDGSTRNIPFTTENGRTVLDIDLPHAGSCFIVIDSAKEAESVVAAQTIKTVDLSNDWNLSFPEGWGAPADMKIESLAFWKDLDISEEGKSFSGTAVYSKTLPMDEITEDCTYTLDLGVVEQIAKVYVNGNPVSVLWSEPYSTDITEFLKSGENEIKVEVTSAWYNRLAYDESLAPEARKTWVLYGPAAGSPYRPSGLLGPVKVEACK